MALCDVACVHWIEGQNLELPLRWWRSGNAIVRRKKILKIVVAREKILKIVLAHDGSEHGPCETVDPFHLSKRSGFSMRCRIRIEHNLCSHSNEFHHDAVHCIVSAGYRSSRR